MKGASPAEGYGGRLATGTGANLAATGVLFLCNFLLTPFLLAHLGDTRYSLFVLAQSIVGFSRLLTLGIPGSLSRFMSEAAARQDPARLTRSFSTGLVLLAAVGALTVLVVLLLVELFPRIFPVAEDLRGPARWVLFILGMQVALTMPLLGFQMVYQAAQKFYIPSLTRLTGAALRTVTIFLVFSLGYVKLVLWALIVASFEVIQGLFLAVRARGVLHGLRFQPSNVKREDFRRLLGFSVWVFLGGLGFLLYYNIDYLLIHWFVDPEKVALYNLAARWDPMLRTVVGSFTALLVPVTAGLGATKDLEELRRLLVRSTKYCLLVALPACLMLIIFARPFLVAWAGTEYGEAAPVMVVLLLPLILTLSQTPSFAVFVGLGKAKLNGLLTLSFAILNIGLSIYLVVVWNLGLVGIALGTALTYFVRTGIISPWYVCRITGQRWGDYVLRAILLPIATAIPMVLAGLVLREVVAPRTLPAIAAVMLLASVAFFLPAWFLILDGRDREVVRSTFRRLAG